MTKALTKEQTERRHRDGRGQGEGPRYRSWLQAHDFPSHGNTTRLTGRLVERQYVTFSNNERRCLLLLQRLPNLVDIREQFPLWPLDATMRIASRLGVKHPAIRGLPQVVTTDFLLTATDGARTWYEAIEVKPWKMLDNRRIIEKLDIQREYWRGKRVPFGIVTERQLPKDLIANLEWIDECHDLAESTVPSRLIPKVLASLRRVSGADPTLGLADACARVDEELHLDEGAGLRCFRHALSRRLWRPSLKIRISGREPLSTYGGANAWPAIPGDDGQDTAA